MPLLDPSSRPGAPAPSARPPAAPLGFAVVDVETTGFAPARERVVEVAVVHVGTTGQVEREWTTLLHPQQDSVGPTHVHGITADDVRGAPAFGEVAAELADLLAGRVVVAHNARFDLDFLTAEFARAGVAVPDLVHLCTLRASWQHWPGLRQRRLADCCEAAGVALDDAHAALSDARAAAGLLRSYLRAAAEAGDGALVDLASRATAVAWPSVPRTGAAPLPRSRRPGAPAAPPPLRAGQRVAFTGGSREQRRALEGRARAAGLVVTGTVSARTDLLVTDDPASGTAKARAAAEHGVPVVSPAAFAALVDARPPAPS